MSHLVIRIALGNAPPCLYPYGCTRACVWIMRVHHVCRRWGLMVMVCALAGHLGTRSPADIDTARLYQAETPVLPMHAWEACQSQAIPVP
jgi:hypothetical protein